GGLGFGMKWMMGWMNDTLKYFKHDPIYRQFHHHQLTFSLTYAFSENFMLPFSHDEVVHGKSAMIYKMPGDEWQKFANLRSLYAYMFTHPGTKLLFMGNEFAQTGEWNFLSSLDWHLLKYAPHAGMLALIKGLNSLYKTEPALYQYNFDYRGFEWLDADDAHHSVYAYMRKGKAPKDSLIVLLNLTPVVRKGYKVALEKPGVWEAIFSTDEIEYYGSGNVITSPLTAVKESYKGKKYCCTIDLPALSCTVLKRQPAKKV
ncbi:MAG: 1,4-alpha-glucan branching protein GlgB, partial [Pedobacter sp.]